MMFDPENKINKLCAAGMLSEGEGKPEEAASTFQHAWDEATTDLEKCVAAHYQARHQPTIDEKLKWDTIALDSAKTVETDEAANVLPSLYLNIAKCHEDLGELDKACEHYLLAKHYTATLTDDPYNRMIATGIINGLKRVVPR